MANSSEPSPPSPRIETGDRPPPPSQARAKAPRSPSPPRRRNGGGGGKGGGGGDESGGPRRRRAPAGGPGFVRRLWGRRWFRTLLAWSVSAGIMVCVAVAAVITWYATNLPSLDSLTAQTRRPSVTLLSADGKVIAATGDVYGDAVNIRDLPKWMPEALLATEDRRFYSHFGVDVIGMLRAAFADMRAGHVVEGGSTLTQQLAKNLFLNADRNFSRKIQEAILAVELEHEFTKDQILSLYLNRMYLGNGIWGVDAAAHRYFGISAKQLSLYQSALIAGLLKAPSRYNPDSSVQLSRQRTAQVLQNMVDTGYITRAQADEANESGPASVVPDEHIGKYFADWVGGQVQQYAGTGGKDLVVHTTIDLTLEKKVEQELTAMLASPAGLKAGIGQGAVVVMTPDGAVRAMVGGRDYAASQFNRATQAFRQPGSSFKAFLYLTAMEQGWTPDHSIDDSPITEGAYRPRDFERDYEGMISLRHAFAKSSNVAAVRLIEAIGPQREIATAHALGITAPLSNDASLALGTSAVTPLEMTSAYATFANYGNQVFAFGIDSIADAKGNVIYRRQPGGHVALVPPPALAAMDDLMSAVVNEGTGKAARLPDRPVAGKTGTTQDSRDAWFIGFSADYVTTVWMGNDDNSPMKKITGGMAPAQLWHQVMMTAEQGLPARPLPLPAGAVEAQPAGPPGQTAPGAPVAQSQTVSATGSDPIANAWHSVVRLFGG